MVLHWSNCCCSCLSKDIEDVSLFKMYVSSSSEFKKRNTSQYPVGDKHSCFAHRPNRHCRRLGQILCQLQCMQENTQSYKYYLWDMEAVSFLLQQRYQYSINSTLLHHHNKNIVQSLQQTNYLVLVVMNLSILQGLYPLFSYFVHSFQYHSNYKRELGLTQYMHC